MNEKEIRQKTEALFETYREYLLTQPKENQPLLRENHKIEFPQHFTAENVQEEKLRTFIVEFAAAFNRLPAADRHLLSCKFLGKEKRSNHVTAAKIGFSLSGYHHRRIKALNNLALSIGLKKPGKMWSISM